MALAVGFVSAFVDDVFRSVRSYESGLESNVLCDMFSSWSTLDKIALNSRSVRV